MTRIVIAACALVVAIAGCDVRQVVLESELAPGFRDQLVRECCECLANGQTFVAGDACSAQELPPPDDAGPLTRNPCLCGGTDGDTCADVLIAGGIVDVVGGCTAPGGQCATPCEGVLAYP